MTESGWTTPDPEIAAFLDEFDRRGEHDDGAAVALFAPQFLTADPTRALVLTPEILAGVLPARRRMFQAAGVGKIRREAARQLRLDERHVLVAADWAAPRAGAAPVRLASTFLVRREPDGPRVLVYLNHHDVAALLAG